jgi:hypothetical protein
MGFSYFNLTCSSRFQFVERKREKCRAEVAALGSPRWNRFTSTGRVVLLALEVRLGLWKRSYSTKASYFCGLVPG